jgi:hypothetical protein
VVQLFDQVAALMNRYFSTIMTDNHELATLTLNSDLEALIETEELDSESSKKLLAMNKEIM